MANLTETTQSQQDVIRELERQLDNKSRNEKDLNEVNIFSDVFPAFSYL